MLVLGIDLPSSIPTASANQAILQYLIDLMPKLGISVIVFLLLGMSWYGHQRVFHFIKYIDTNLLWINIIFLIFIAIAPFSANLAGDYGIFQMGILPLELNILITNLIFSYMWHYIISRPKMLSHELNSFEIARLKQKQIVQVTLALAAICISFINPTWSTLPYFLLFYLTISNRYRLLK